ncbi:MAG: hypothetical protein NC120_11820, partial [Ruminococcus sp.]|nr:hypothetical protein [Ruminococcus sp.]
MSKKRKRGKGDNSLSSENGAARKQKAARYAEKTLNVRNEERFPMGTSENGEFADNFELDVLTDKSESGKLNDRKELQKKAAAFRAEENKAAEIFHSDNTPNAVITDLSETEQEIPIDDEKISTAEDKSAKQETEKDKDNSDSKISDPKTAERMKKAVFIKHMNEAKIAAQRFVPADDLQEEKQADVRENTEKLSESYTEGYRENTGNVSHSEDKSADPQTVRRLKKAAYIRQMNELKAAQTITPTDNEFTEHTSQAQETIENISPSESAVSHIEAIDNLKKSAYIKDKFDEKNENRILSTDEYSNIEPEQTENIKKKSPEVSVLEAAEYTAEFVSAVKSGNAAKAAAFPIKKVIENGLKENAALQTAEAVSAAVKNSDNVGSAAAAVGTAIAADKIRRYVNGGIFGRSDKAERNVKRYIHLKKADKISADNKKKNAEKQRFKIKTVKKNSAAKKNLQREFYIGHNREILTYTPKTEAVKIVGKKLVSKLLSVAAAAIIPFFIVIIAVMLISSFFSWVMPFDFTLAGSDEEISAETADEILDGYTLMIQNYFDVAQAEYYLEYGDWYGGVYDYPSAGECLTFADYLSEKFENIINSIREQFANAIANAPNEQAAAAIAQAMERAINDALMQAQDGAAEEYQALIDSLDDSMTAEEKRQHFEVVNIGGANGIADSDEFNGKPIEGTNFFGNSEIQSELSAEELLAMTALYKSLKLLQSGGESEDGNYTYNITENDIMELFKETEYIQITAEITHNNFCAGQNCRRQLVGNFESGYSWEYYCLADHDNLNGSIEPCIGKDELLEKISELTEAEENGFDSGKC